MARHTHSWLITMYYTTHLPCFRAILFPNNSLLSSKKWKASKKKKYSFYICTVHLDIIKVCYLPTDELYISLRKH